MKIRIILPDISKWDTSKVFSMKFMFSFNFVISSLPDISFWNTNELKNANGLFDCCEKLSSIPDISKWNMHKSTDMPTEVLQRKV